MSGYSSHVAGVYGEVQNLGSLVVRLVFWPIETSAFRIFSVRGKSGADGDTGGAHAGSTDLRSLPENARNLEMLQVLHRVMVLVAALAAVFGPNYAFVAIHVLLSHRWSSTEAPALLATYSLTLVCLGVNGVMEAYSHARMSSAQLMRANAFMAATTLGHAGLLYALNQLSGGADSSQALVLLDALSMCVRIAYSFVFVHWLHRGRLGDVRLWLPAPASAGALVVAYSVLSASKRNMLRHLGNLQLARLPQPLLVHVAVGVIVLFALSLALMQTERTLVRVVRSMAKSHAD